MTPVFADDAQLIHAFQKGSQSAFETLYSHYYLALYHVAFALLGSREEVEDAEEEFL
jgi:DNA-directed RNA polymerase specialized sigma24 family protein